MIWAGFPATTTPSGISFVTTEPAPTITFLPMWTLGRIIAPVFTPCGFGNWQAAVSLISGFAAKEAVVSEVFPYIGSIGSEVGKNAALQSLAEKLHISEKAVSDDFRVFSEKNHDRTKTAATRPTLKTEPPVPAVRTDDSQEFFLFAALVAEPACFEQVRRCIGVEDLVSARAREIYYLLEDAYRKNRLNSDAILSMMEDSSAVRFIVEKLADNEFSSENIKKMIPDLILQERIFILKNKIDDLQFKISHSSGKSRETVDNFIREKIKYEKELSKLKP